MTVPRDVKIQVVTLRNHTSKSQRTIARELGIARHTVASILKLYDETGSVENHGHDRRGRQEKLMERTRRRIVIESKKDPRKTAREIQQEVGGDALNVGIRTIQRILIEEGRKSYRPIKGINLTAAHKQKRLSWALTHVNLTVDDFWNNVSNFSFIVFFILFKHPRLNSSGNLF